MDIKACKGCSESKPLSEFYPHPKMGDGRLNFCKVCKRKDSIQYRNDNIDRIREHDRQRGMLPHRVAARDVYRKTSMGKKAITRAHKRYAKKFPVKTSARNILNNAVRDGKVSKPKACSECDYKGRIHGHHEDYTKPLDVVWLCDTCHRKRH